MPFICRAFVQPPKKFISLNRYWSRFLQAASSLVLPVQHLKCSLVSSVEVWHHLCVCIARSHGVIAFLQEGMPQVLLLIVNDHLQEVLACTSQLIIRQCEK